MVRSIKTSSLFVCLLLVGMTQAWAGIFPTDPTELDTVRLVGTYDCPYPASTKDPEITINGDQIEVLVILNGSICLTGEFPDVSYAFELGEFEAGDYHVTLRHTTLQSRPLIVGPVYEFDFTVENTVSPRFSGVWSDDNGELHAVNVTFMEPGSALFSWQTYDPDGNPLWLTGTVDVEGDELVGEVFLGRNQTFGQFDGNARRTPWGSVRMRFSDCETAVLTWRSTLDDYRNGALVLGKLATPFESEGCTPHVDFFLPHN